MKKGFLTSVLLVASFFVEAKDHNVIYGEDDRKDLYELNDPHLLLLAQATVGVIAPKIIVPRGNGRVKLKSRKIKIDLKICPDERFADQEGAAYCTGFLIAPDIIVTAGHCIESQMACENTKFVFDYAMKAPDHVYNETHEDNIYGCDTLIFSENPKKEGTGRDLAIVRLDRKANGRTPLVFENKSKLANDDELFIIGHPLGLPTKYADNAVVTKIENTAYFRATLDAFTGNSGSPVFNQKTRKVEGILIAGENDFEKTPKGKCHKIKICHDSDECAGELVLRSSEVLDTLPEKLFPNTQIF